MEVESIAKRSLARTLLMIGFHILVYLFSVKTIRDTQCGFKLFTRGAAARVIIFTRIRCTAHRMPIIALIIVHLLLGRGSNRSSDLSLVMVF